MEYKIIISLNVSEAIPEVKELTEALNSTFANCGVREKITISADMINTGTLKVDRLLTATEKTKIEEIMTKEWKKVFADYKAIGDYSKNLVVRLEMSREETAVSQ